MDATGKPTRLFELLRGPQATTLVFGAPAPAEPHTYAVLRPGKCASGVAVFDPDGNAFRAYDAIPGTTVHIRPDGYVGGREGDLHGR